MTAPEVCAGLGQTRFRQNIPVALPQKIPTDCLLKVLANLPAVPAEHAHLERKAATSTRS